MANMTKHSVLYAIDPADQSLMTLSRITNMDLGAVSATTTDIQTWADRTPKPIRTGIELAEASITLYPDNVDPIHKRLYELSRSTDTDGPETDFALGWSDGTEAPTIATDGSFTLPTSRTFFTFKGWISSFPLDFSEEVVKTELKIQRTDLGAWIPKVVV